MPLLALVLEARAAVMLEEDMAAEKPDLCLDCRQPLSIEGRAKGLKVCGSCDDEAIYRRETWDEESNAEPIDSRPS